MADRIQYRRDTAARWAEFNPVLLEGEVGYVTDNPNQYKIGDGVNAWNDLPLRGYTGTISQEIGNDENAVMSQKAVSYLTGLSEYPVFSEGKDYAVGDVVNKDGKLYEFMAEHAAGTWIGTDTEETSVKKEFEKKDIELDRYNKSIQKNNLLNGLEQVVGEYYSVNGSIITGSNFFRIKDRVNISEGNIYVYTGLLYGDMYISFFDKLDNLITQISINQLSSPLVLSYNYYDDSYIDMLMFRAPSDVSYIKYSSAINSKTAPALYLVCDERLFKNTIKLKALSKTGLIKDDLLIGSFYTEKNGKISRGSNPDAACLSFDISDGEYIYVKTQGNSSAPCIIYCDEDDNVISINRNNNVEDCEIVPNGTKKLYINLYPFQTGDFNLKLKYGLERFINSVQENNILNRKTVVNGYYSNNGVFYSSASFQAIQESIELNMTGVYIYTGMIFGDCYLSFYDENDEYVGKIGIGFLDNVIDVVYNDDETQILSITFIPLAKKVKVSSYKATLSQMGLYLKNIKISNDPKWTIPNKIYAVVGAEKSIYFDNIVNTNDNARGISIDVLKYVGTSNRDRFYFTPRTIEDLVLIKLSAYNIDNNNIGSKYIKFNIISNIVPTKKRIVCIGDSITEKYNMPYYIQEALKSVLSEDSQQPEFVGTKGGVEGMANKPTKHEGWYGMAYQWLAGIDGEIDGNISPFVDPDTNKLDIHYYRTIKLGLGESDYIDVVNLAMGFNGLTPQEEISRAFNAMVSIINAFKEDNSNTKFIIQLPTYPAKGNVRSPEEDNTEKKNKLYKFRKLCLDNFDEEQDSNVIIGDWGLCYDRWFAYPRVKEKAASFYSSDDIEVITDRVHPTEEGTNQMAYAMLPSIVKMLQ